MPVSGSPKNIVHEELHRFKHGELHSGSDRGPIVENRKQAIAIALNMARKHGRAFGGGMTHAPNPNWLVRGEARSMLHSGPILSAVPGRTDRHDMKLGSGSYVIPSQAVSHLGQNNTLAGFKVLNGIFGPGGPYGTPAMKLGHGSGAPKPPKLGSFARGGHGGDHEGEPVDVVTAGGEYVIRPEIVRNVGGGDIHEGHEILDAWVNKLKRDHIKALKRLPGPAKS